MADRAIAAIPLPNNKTSHSSSDAGVLNFLIEAAMIDYMKGDANKEGLKNYHSRSVKPDDPGVGPHSADVVFFCDTLHHMDDRVAYDQSPL